MGAQNIGRGADQKHRVEIRFSVERQILQEWVHRMGVEHKDPGAAVRRRFCGLGSSKGAGCTRLVLDDNSRAQTLLEPRLRHACNRIDSSAWRKGHDNSDRSLRKGLRHHGPRDGRQRRSARDQTQEFSARKFH